MNEAHAELVERAGRWLKSFGCSVVIKEMVAWTGTGEIPDAIGWKCIQSILIECKVNRNDFLKDKKKTFRQFRSQGLGCRRLYLCPPGVINKEDLPEGWGLLWTQGKRIRRIVAPKGNCFPYDGACYDFTERNRNGEIAMLVSALRRKDQFMKDRIA